MLATWVNTLYRRPWRVVVSKYVWYLVVFYVLRTPVFIWNRIARYPFLVILGNFWRLIFRSWAPNFGVKHDTQVKNTAKYAKYSWRERGYFIRDIISPSCGNKTQWWKTSKPWICPFIALFLWICFSTFPCRRGHCTTLTSGDYANIWQSISELK